MGKFEVSINNPILKGARQGFDTCLKLAIARAIKTGSNEGSATLKVSFEFESVEDKETREISIAPEFKYKAGYAVPIKDSIDGEVIEISRIVPKEDGDFMLVNGQITMDEMLEDETEE